MKNRLDRLPDSANLLEAWSIRLASHAEAEMIGGSNNANSHQRYSGEMAVNKNP